MRGASCFNHNYPADFDIPVANENRPIRRWNIADALLITASWTVLIRSILKALDVL